MVLCKVKVLEGLENGLEGLENGLEGLGRVRSYKILKPKFV